MTIVEPKLEDDLNYFVNGRQPQFFGKWKTTSILRKMEDDHNFKVNGRLLQFFILWKIEDDLHFKENER